MYVLLVQTVFYHEVHSLLRGRERIKLFPADLRKCICHAISLLYNISYELYSKNVKYILNMIRMAVNKFKRYFDFIVYFL